MSKQKTIVDLNKPYLQGLTYKQKLFVEYYKGNNTEAARLAGYSQAEQSGYENMNKPDVIKALQERDTFNSQIKNNIISREEMEIELSSIVRDDTAKPETRIKAMERLAKMRGYDKETVEVHGTIENLNDNQLDARMIEALTVIGIESPPHKLLDTPSVTCNNSVTDE